MDSVLALFPCFNRKEKTRQAVRGLVEGNPEVQFSFVIVDDASTDGTPEMLKTEDFGAPIQVIQGTGGLFYSGGMALGMEKILKSGKFRCYTERISENNVYDEADSLLSAGWRLSDGSIISVKYNGIAAKELFKVLKVLLRQ